MTALNTASGEHLWTSPNVGEELYTRPVEFDGVIYAKGLATGAVYAISPRDGSVIGRTEPTNDSLLFAARAGLDTLSDGILFNTAKDLAIYKSK